MSYLEEMINQLETVSKNAEVHNQQQKVNEAYFADLEVKATGEQKQMVIEARVKAQRIINLAKRGDGSHLQAIKDLWEFK